MFEHIVKEAGKNIEHYEDLKKYCTQTHCKDCANSCDVEISYNKTLIEYLEKAKEYKELEEQGLLLRLSCKENDTVYVIYRKKIVSGKIKRIIIHENEIIYSARFEGFPIESLVLDEYFGKTIFLSEEKAEKALADMGV